jgi:DNA polymerase-3 subunit alpha
MDVKDLKVLPLWTSHYSIGNSILTLDEPPKPEDYSKNSPQSIIQICSENGLRDLFLVENNFAGFVKALTNSKKYNLNLNFGLKMVVCEDIEAKSAESLETEHKVVVFARSDKGYKRLVDMYSASSIKGFYYRPRIDYGTIQKYWNDEDLVLAHPFYSSFLHRNLLYGSRCSFNEFTSSFFLIEENDLPFNYLINMAIDNYSKEHSIQRIAVKSIYYMDKNYFKAYIVSKCIQERKTLDCPNLDHFSSDRFSFEDWRRLNT